MRASAASPSVTRQIIIAIALVAVAAVIWSVSDVLVIAFGAIMFATVLRAMVRPVLRSMIGHGRSR